MLNIPGKYRKSLTLGEWLQFLEIHRRQSSAEASLKQRGLDFREIGGDAARSNYGQMSTQEFETINARQQWANWILIGKCLHKRVPDRPLKALDVGCGTGTSTTVLANYLPIGSSIIANDITAKLIETARQKPYTCVYTGDPVKVEFVVQDATEPFIDTAGNPLPPNSIDYLNTSGIVGHHFTPEAFATMATNATKVIKGHGYAAIDEGPILFKKDIVPIMQRLGWTFLRPIRIVPWKSGQLLFQLTL